MNRACFDKVSELVQNGHQVMVFVHARKETVKTAQALREEVAAEGISGKKKNNHFGFLSPKIVVYPSKKSN